MGRPVDEAPVPFRLHFQRWVGSADQEHLILGISDAALMASYDGVGEVELQHRCRLADRRLSALVAVVNLERVAGFPSGRLFLDSIEQALAVALVNGYAVRRRSVRAYQGGLSPARLQRIKDLVHAKMEDELTRSAGFPWPGGVLHEMAQSVELSVAHFSRMFRKSTGESPHQFVLRHRVERAKEMLQFRGLSKRIGLSLEEETPPQTPCPDQTRLFSPVKECGPRPPIAENPHTLELVKLCEMLIQARLEQNQ